MRKVELIIQKEHNGPKEELLEFEGLVTISFGGDDGAPSNQL
jgi:hypothetical protein